MAGASSSDLLVRLYVLKISQPFKTVQLHPGTGARNTSVGKFQIQIIILGLGLLDGGGRTTTPAGLVCPGTQHTQLSKKECLSDHLPPFFHYTSGEVKAGKVE